MCIRDRDVTFVFNAKPSTDATLMCDDVIKIRRGAIATIQNALIKGQGQVKNVLDFTDKKGDANPRTKVEYTSLLTTAPADAEVKGTLNDGNIQKKEGLIGADTSKQMCIRDSQNAAKEALRRIEKSRK